MPVYDYDCAGCGTFRADRRLADWAAPAPCPTCGTPGARALAVPAFSAMEAGRRAALAGNERSRNAPARVSGGAHGAGCGCCRPARSGAATERPATPLKGAGTRPWLLSH